MSHTEHATVTTALDYNCVEGECDHLNEDGELIEECPFVPPFEVCVDCMDEAGAGRDPQRWDDIELIAWPHSEPDDSEAGR